MFLDIRILNILKRYGMIIIRILLPYHDLLLQEEKSALKKAKIDMAQTLEVVVPDFPKKRNLVPHQIIITVPARIKTMAKAVGRRDRSAAFQVAH